jgi:hypothetical protein
VVVAVEAGFAGDPAQRLAERRVGEKFLGLPREPKVESSKS